MDVQKHRERCERWPIERVEAKATLLLFAICALHEDDGFRPLRLHRLRRVKKIYDAKVDRRDQDRRQAKYNARWAKAPDA